jgi:Rrf2 family protein
MIRFSRMADYGVLLLGHFARNELSMASASDLAGIFHMPRAVVANLLKEFGKAGLLESRRGLHGGYMLARDPTDISLFEILSVVDGPVRLIDCATADDDSKADASSACEYEDVCHSRNPLVSVNRQIIGFLEDISLAGLMSDSPPIAAIESNSESQ